MRYLIIDKTKYRPIIKCVSNQSADLLSNQRDQILLDYINEDPEFLEQYGLEPKDIIHNNEWIEIISLDHPANWTRHLTDYRQDS